MPLERKAMRSYMQKYRKTNKQKSYAKTWAKKNPVKAKAHDKMETALRGKKQTKARKCAKCGKTGKLQGHHTNYGKATKVSWLCPMCHAKTKP